MSSERVKQPCTCTGSCRGAEGLGENWYCVLRANMEQDNMSHGKLFRDTKPSPPQPGDTVLVEAKVKAIRPSRDGFIDLDVFDYYYVSDDALDASDVEEIYIRVPVAHIHPAPAKKGEAS